MYNNNDVGNLKNISNLPMEVIQVLKKDLFIIGVSIYI